MKVFEIIMICISLIGLLGAIVKVHYSMRIEIAKIDVEIKHLRADLIQKEIAICKIEKVNRQDHKEIIEKINRLIEK